MRLLLAALILIPWAIAPARAQGDGALAYPTRPVRVILPYAPGGAVDLLMRAIAAELAKRWASPMVVENRPGANGAIGAEFVARSAPDGYTLLATPNPLFTLSRFLYRSLPFDPDRSFQPLTLMVRADQIILGSPGLPVRDLTGLVALARREPGRLSYGSFGVGSQPQLIFETLNRREGLDLVHIPYNGIPQVLLATVQGEVGLTTASLGVAYQQILADRLVPLAVAGERRLPQLPDVPTTVELGYDNLLAPVWYGLFAPANVPRPIVDRIVTDVRSVLSHPDFVEQQITSKGVQAVASTPEEFAEVLRSETALMMRLVQAAGIEPQ